MNIAIAASDRDANRFLSGWLQGATAAPAAEYIALAGVGELPRQAKAESESWTFQFFRPEADPYGAAPPARVSVHMAPDRLRFEYQALGMQIVLDENRTYARVLVTSVDAQRLVQMKLDEQTSVVNRIGSLLFQSRHPWIPRERSSAQETAAFSTSPGTNMMSMPSWQSRVDAGVYQGQLYYLFYQKPEQLMGFLSATGWFDEKFRAKHTKAK
jgi:hypothetical protein